MCTKKYCECVLSGVKCTYLCKCENCMNGGGDKVWIISMILICDIFGWMCVVSISFCIEN
jgi:hypothetical protein